MEPFPEAREGTLPSRWRNKAVTMAEVEVRNLKNKVVEKLTLDEEVFNYTARETLVWEAVRAYQAAQRKGTHATKTRADVRGGGRKPWRQKGTGRARVGSIRSPLWKKGGVTFGPQPRDYEQSFPKKKRRGALKMVLSDKLRNQKLTVIDEISLESPRTKEFLGVLENFKLEEKILVVDDSLLTRRMLVDALNTIGFSKIYEATDGVEGVEQYKKLKPDLTTLDIVMPNKDGLEALKEIMELDPNANIIMITSVGQDHYIDKSKELGAKFHLIKPFKKEILNDTINKIFENTSFVS